MATFCGAVEVQSSVQTSLLSCFYSRYSTVSVLLVRAVARLREPCTRIATRTSTKRLATDDEGGRHPEQSAIGQQDQFAERKSCSFDKGTRGVQSSALSRLRRESSHFLRPREYVRAGKGRSRCDAVEAQGAVAVVHWQWYKCGDTGRHLHTLSPLPSPIHPTTGLGPVLSALSWNPSESQRMMLNCTIKTHSRVLVQSATLGFVHALLTWFRPVPRVTYSQVRGPWCLRRSPTRICSARSARTSCGTCVARPTAVTCSARGASSSTLTPMGEPARSAEKRESRVPAQLPVIVHHLDRRVNSVHFLYTLLNS